MLLVKVQTEWRFRAVMTAVTLTAAAARSACKEGHPCDEANVQTDAEPPPPQPQYVRLEGAGQTCSLPEYRNIDTPEQCEEAFRVLTYTAKRHDQVIQEKVPFKPRGCYSDCFSEHAGYHCRKFNIHPTGNGQGSTDKRLMLCGTSNGTYVRLHEEKATCIESGYTDITEKTDCEDAFHQLRFDKEMEQVFRTRSKREAKGCSSSCFDPWSGYFCRKFNRHPTGRESGISESEALICEQL
eukprot:TRINITY_DN78231_c0_g1_i1.p1 TRINITY_DN78231_c0_g1~~TRINITY_DN78231_c0_g1_i1.p1  ORF type:complete len:240 (+),score=28.57 TRINITY_DN78231_c0_g1_i1:72-791(+)